MFNSSPPPYPSGKSCRLMDIVEKQCRAEETTDDIMAYALSVLDN